MARSTLGHLFARPPRGAGGIRQFAVGAPAPGGGGSLRTRAVARAAVPRLDHQPAVVRGRGFHRVAARLKNDIISLPLIVQASTGRTADPEIGPALKADITAVFEHDPACERFIEPFLYFKGFHAIQAHRLTHWLWHNRRA